MPCTSPTESQNMSDELTALGFPQKTREGCGRPKFLVGKGFPANFRAFLKGGTLTRGNDIRVTPGMTVR